MEQVSMNDGLDGRETIAFGLAAGEVAVFVLALMSAYAVLRSGLPGAIAWTLAALLVAGGAVLAWGRLAGRPMLEWAVLLAGFTVRTRQARAARLRERLGQWSAAARAVMAAVRLRLASRSASPARPLQSGAVVIPLALRRLEGPALGAGGGRGHVVGFFSLAGGTGRTTLAVEVAAMLALRGRVAAATGPRGARVALLDLAGRNPSVGVRLGIPAPSDPGRRLIAHETGLLVGVAPASPFPSDTANVAMLRTLIDSPECAAADIVVVDFDCDRGELCNEVLRRCDQVMVTLTPTAGGVVDAYRSTAVLRRLGLRDRSGHVVNRWRAGVELGETMADLGGEIAAEIPDDHAFVEAENHHRIAGLDADSDVAAALSRLATHIEHAAGVGRSSADARRWGSNAG